MSARGRRAIAGAAIAVTAGAALLGVRRCRHGTAPAAATAASDARVGADGLTAVGGPPGPARTPRVRSPLVLPGPGAGAGAAPADGGVAASPSTFEHLCKYSPRARCEPGRALAAACDAGTAAACRELAEAFLTAPIQPMGGELYLSRACTLGDAAGCDRWDQLLAWKKWPEGKRDGDVAPAEACGRDVIACWYDVTAAWSRDQRFDDARAWRACDGGVSDACGLLAGASPDPAGAVRALEVGCAASSPLHCGGLASMYGDGKVCCPEPVPALADRGDCLPCPAQDRARAAQFAARVAELTGHTYDPGD